jgi:dephospho-CoA kinase
MLLAGLTGGIGAGKSTFAALLAERGAVVIDADKLGHEAIAPGEPAWQQIVEHFGDEVRAAGSMEIDRKLLGRIVFQDPAKLTVLNAITHPEILRRIADQIDRHRNSDDVVVLDAALIVEMGLADSLDLTIVVATDTEIRRARLVQDRGMTSEHVDERIGAQSTTEDLIARADIVVRNDGSVEDLTREADRVWLELKERAS